MSNAKVRYRRRRRQRLQREKWGWRDMLTGRLIAEHELGPTILTGEVWRYESVAFLRNPGL